MALQEMKYCWVFNDETIREGTLSQKRETFKQYTAHLQLMVDW